MIKRVIVSGDFLRPSRGVQRPSQHHNIQWLHHLVGNQIAEATGLPVEMVAWCHDVVAKGRLTQASIQAIYGTHSIPLSIDGWAALYDLPEVSEEFDAFIAWLFHDSVAVFFELPKVVERVLARHGIPYVDLTIHPVRFLDDIYLGFRASTAAMQASLDAFRLPEPFIRAMAGIQKAAAGRRYTYECPPNSMLLLLQVRDDKTQISDGRFIGAGDCLEPIVACAARHSRCLLRPHPFDRDNPHMPLLKASIPNLVTTDENYYRLLSLDQIATVASLSSGTCIEAPYFGKTETYFFKKPYLLPAEGKPAGPDEYVGVYDAFLNPDFWREVLSSACPVTRRDGVEIPRKPNRLRQSLRDFWRFNEIDSDILVEQYVARTRKPIPV